MRPERRRESKPAEAGAGKPAPALFYLPNHCGLLPERKIPESEAEPQLCVRTQQSRAAHTTLTAPNQPSITKPDKTAINDRAHAHLWRGWA